MQTLRKKTSPCKYRNDPGRFFGDGVKFKAKLIGILEVGEARGDRMCQEALQDLKMALRAAGEHKQRITIHVTIDGLRLRDEKTGDSLYHHPVHKISFIAQDMTDSRAFGYIFGSPDSGHRFFGIKTDKAASQVVLAMRDLFQVVFELKKKEIELARQQIQSKSIHEHQMASLSSLKSTGVHNDLSGSGATNSLSMLGSMGGSQGASSVVRLGVNLTVKGAALSPESVADLVDLEQELSSIQRGITQMERITPSEPTPAAMAAAGMKTSTEDDPFGDSFATFPTYNLLPPPESGRSRHKPSKPTESNANSALTTLISPAPISSGSPATLQQQQQDDDDSWLNELDQQNDVFDTSKTGTGVMGLSQQYKICAPLAPSESTSTPTQQLSECSAGPDSELALPTSVIGNSDALSAIADPSQNSPAGTTVKSDAFTDLDPLGTGRTRPYVDKKYFFQELKNPPKKVLKDFSSSGTAEANYSAAAAVVDEFLSKEGLFDDATMNAATSTAAAAAATTARNQPQSLPPLQPQKAFNVTNPPNNTADAVLSAPPTAGDPVLLPRDTDPFSPTRKKSDPFNEGDIFSKLDPFEFEFSGRGGGANREQDTAPRVSPMAATATAPAAGAARHGAEVFNGPLQVTLPPEPGISPPPFGGAGSGGGQWRGESALRHSPHTVMGNGSIGSGRGRGTSTVRSRPTPFGGQQSASGIGAGPSAVFKQQTAVDVLSSISNKKMPHLFGQARFSKRVGGDSNSINMRRLQESGDSLSENEAAPEPPPRPDLASHVEPPPLPPKKQFNEIIIRPRVTSGTAVPSACSISPSSRYEFINSVSRPSTAASSAGDVPPIPLPSRRIGRSDGAYPGPGRPRKPGHTEDDYLAPIDMAVSATAVPEVPPPLLPPPTHISTRTRTQRQQTQSKAQEIYENKTEILQQQQTMDDGAEASAAATAAIIPDITLSQLLTLGIDELAVKLGVPASKLSTMTLVELTTYLSEFIEKSKTSAHPQSQSLSPVPAEQAPIFRVNFDQQATFVAKFDDTFGEDLPRSSGFGGIEAFVANFAQFNEPPTAPAPIHSTDSGRTPAVPPADRYAVFREIIDQELQQQQEDTDLIGDMDADASTNVPPLQMESNLVQVTSYTTFEAHFEADDFLSAPPPHGPQAQPPKIDTKITEVVAQAKDRYAALRDIILVENLFEKNAQTQDLLQDEFCNFNEDQDLKQIMADRASSAGTGADRIGLVDSRGFPAEPSSSALTVQDDDEDEDGGAESSLDSNEKDAEINGTESRGLPHDQYEKLSTSTQQLDVDKSEGVESAALHSSNLAGLKQDSKFLTVAGTSGLCSSKDDLEIDELMQRAISNLSLDSRERISPANSTHTPALSGTPAVLGSLVLANGVRSASLNAQAQQFNDVSTSPIPVQKSPQSTPAQKLTPVASSSKSPQASPILSQLSAVSNLIDVATKQIGSGDLLSESERSAKESWATFDSPKPEVAEKCARAAKSAKPSTTLLHLPPPPPSNTSQNDTAESPCSSDPRDDGWVKTGTGGVGAGSRRWPKKERQQTSSSSRDLSPWDDEAPEFQKQKRIPVPPPPGQPHAHAPDRHGYYMRHARRMNSCDEDNDYDDEFNYRRDHRKFKQGISRSRDNFDLDSPSWYHHAPHHTWSPQDAEQSMAARGRSFERSAYERSTYGPPIYDKRGVALPPPVPPGSSSYDRRSGYDKRKYYRDRDYARPNYDFEEYSESPPIYREAGSFEKLKMGRRSDYENVYDDGRSPMSMGGGGGYKSRTEYMYDRDRKSFDRESLESFESATRRRRSFGSGDVYGSIESREDFRDRYMGGVEKTRSLRKSVKLRATGDIDYEQDSENDFPQQRSRGGPVDTRSLQRPSQLAAAGVVGGINTAQSRLRKSSGSSPWDGDEPPLPGQKSWKRPSSAADSERRMAESRRVAGFGQTPSGSDGEKDRRYRRKQRARGKDLPPSSVVAGTGISGGRYGNYDYITYDDDNEDEDDDDYVDEEYEEPPTDEDKFERLNRRRHEMHQRMLESERRQHGVSKTAPATLKCGAKAIKKYHVSARGGEFEYEEYEQTPTPRSNASASGGSAANTTTNAAAATKFSFDGGFESDFNQSSPPPAPAVTASSCTSSPAVGMASTSATATPATKSSFRFSNDFSEREHRPAFGQNSTSASSLQQFDLDAVPSPALHVTPPITQKLRFDDNVKVSQFDDAAFEDDFSKAQFDFEKEDQWHADALQTSGNNAAVAARKHNLRNSKLQQRQELIKKSESINIFAKKAEDPFEDDEFFQATGETNPSDSGATAGSNGAVKNGNGSQFQWDDGNNFAKFDENM